MEERPQSLEDYIRMRGGYRPMADPMKAMRKAILRVPIQIARAYVEANFKENPGNFRYICVMPFLPADNDDAAWSRYVDIVTAKSKYAKCAHEGYDPEAWGIKRFTPQEILQICVLQTPPFCFEGGTTRPEKIRDVHISDNWHYNPETTSWCLPKESQDQWHACHDRVQLVEKLAGALYDYECLRRMSAETGPAQAMKHFTKEAFDIVRESMNYLLRDRDEGDLKPRGRLPHKKKTITTALKVIEDMEAIITPEDCQLMYLPSARSCRDDLIILMCEFWQAYGPQRHSGEVLWHALAAILLALGIESSQPKAAEAARKSVASRLRGRMRQAGIPLWRSFDKKQARTYPQT
jgi:hypothetical protein